MRRELSSHFVLVVPLPLWIPSAVLSLFSPHSSLFLSLWIPSAVPSLFPRTHPLSEVPCHWLLVRVVLVFCSGGSSPSVDSECGPISPFPFHSSLSLSVWIPSAVPSLFPRTHPLSEVPCHWLLVRVVLVFCSGGSSPSVDSECGPISLLPSLVPLPFCLDSECGPISLSPHSSLSLSVWIPSAVLSLFSPHSSPYYHCSD
jgi:hypothetical protein